MKSIAFVLLISVGACGNKSGNQPIGNAGSGEGSGSNSGVVRDTRTPYMQRREAACERVAPKITACAVEDAKAQHAAGKVSKEQLDKDTAPEVQAKNTEKFVEACAVPGTTYQLRVLEVCEKEETECGALLECLEHMKDGK